MDNFVLRALLGGLGVALVAGPLGCFVVWRRMAYFGDTLAHAGLLGVGLGLLLGVSEGLGVLVICVAIAMLLFVLQQQRVLAGDTVLGILAHSALSLGLVVISFMETLRVDLIGYLFGDILALSDRDLYWIWGAGLAALLVLWRIWQPLLAVTVHRELAQVEGVPVLRVQLAFMLLIALVVATAMKVVGILLITSLLIIPAATARRYARTPEMMALLAAACGATAVAAGLWGSLRWDTPTGPSMVVAAAALFAIAVVLPAPARSTP